MKICTIVGARPQFIKAAALSRVLGRSHEEIIVHTGQHYDRNMSDIFFEELSIPRPHHNLGVSGASHGRMTGEMLIALEETLMNERPDMALVYGDTNSTLAGALAAVKLQIPICHVEAGMRIGTLLQPEEANRVMVDRISALLCCCTETAVKALAREGITEGVHNTGDLMYDALLYYGDRLQRPDWAPDAYYLLTCHRQENTGDDKLTEILLAMEELDAPAIYPVHPRNRERAARLSQALGLKNTIFTEPVGYLASLWLIKHAKKVITDSGGLQREAWFYGVPCVTMLGKVLWPETHGGNMNQLCAPDKAEILRKLAVTPDFSQKSDAFGDGHAAGKITGLISGFRPGCF